MIYLIITPPHPTPLGSPIPNSLPNLLETNGLYLEEAYICVHILFSSIYFFMPVL